MEKTGFNSEGATKGVIRKGTRESPVRRVTSVTFLLEVQGVANSG